MVRAALVILLLLGLAISQVASQPSFSGTNSVSVTPSNLPPPSPSTSPSGSSSGSVSGSNSVSVTGTWTRSGSTSGTPSVTVTASASWTVSTTASNSVTPPPAPINVVNNCPGHIINICPGWDNPANTTYVSYIVTFVQNACPTCTPTSFTTSSDSGRVTNLLPSTSYDFTVVGVTASGLHSLASTPVTFTTDPTDAKIDPAKDINNIVCVSAVTSTGRTVINCSWNAAAERLTRLVIKWRCVSEIRENDANKKRLYGNGAQVTSVTLNVNRDVATCYVFLRAYYARRPATRHALTVIMGF